MPATNPYKVGDTVWMHHNSKAFPYLVEDTNGDFVRVTHDGHHVWLHKNEVSPTESDALTQRADLLQREAAALRERAREAREREASNP